MPIGRPVANTQLYILDKHLQPVPIGAVGELHIGGVQVGRGYWQRPELTAEKFIPDPFRSDPEAHLYKTGDLARYLPDGVIEYLGRIDHQVKIRGFRIELGEIESVLLEHPEIREAVVVVWDSESGEQRLVAYIVFVSGKEPSIVEVRNHLRQMLPEYMIPAHFAVLQSLPLTHNGKVNRLALPAPDMTHRNIETPLVLPRTHMETTLAELWCEILGLGQIGINDNFFDVGGNLILATKVIARLRKTMRIDLSLRDLFIWPTVATFSCSRRRKTRANE